VQDNGSTPLCSVIMAQRTKTAVSLAIHCHRSVKQSLGRMESYPVFIPKPSTHRMHDLESIVPHIQPKVFTDNQMSSIKYDYYYINSVSKNYDDSQRNGTAKDSITPQERQPVQHVAYNSSLKNSSPLSPSEQQVWVARENSKVEYTYGWYSISAGIK
jgi:hypothetical protein